MELYGILPSPPVRAAALAIEAVGKTYELKSVSTFKGEHKSPEYLKLNPQHKIPTLKDGDFVLSESRAIMGYLASAYGDEKLYPKDLRVRALVDHRLYFDMGIFFDAFAKILVPGIMQGEAPTEDALNRLKETLGWVNDFVKPTGYAAGTDSLTIADLSLVATFSSIEACDMVDLSPYAELTAWFKRIKEEAPNYKSACGDGAQELGNFYKAKVPK